MPQLKPASTNVQTFYLPSTENAPEADRAWVKMDMGPLTAGDLLGISSPDTNAALLAATVLAERITEWNYTDENGSPVPITLDAVKRLDVNDYVFLQQQLMTMQQPTPKLSIDEKKA